VYVCLCNAITSSQVRRLGEAGTDTPQALIRALRLDDEEACGFCMHHIGRLVAIARGGDPLEYGRFRLDPANRVDFDNPDDTP
jgi:bacterioferritin-associated ferredoxin